MTAGRQRRANAFPHPRPQAADWPARLVLASTILAAVAMLSLPQARGASATFGLLPFWLAVLPAAAWLALALVRRGPRDR